MIQFLAVKNRIIILILGKESYTSYHENISTVKFNAWTRVLSGICKPSLRRMLGRSSDEKFTYTKRFRPGEGVLCEFECSPMRLVRWPPAEIGTAIPRFRDCFRQRPIVVERERAFPYLVSRWKSPLHNWKDDIRKKKKCWSNKIFTDF